MFVSAPEAVEVMKSSTLTPDVLEVIWDLADFGRDGKLNQDEFAIAAHLLRHARLGRWIVNSKTN